MVEKISSVAERLVQSLEIPEEPCTTNLAYFPQFYLVRISSFVRGMSGRAVIKLRSFQEMTDISRGVVAALFSFTAFVMCSACRSLREG